jgi:hypothetical protein
MSTNPTSVELNDSECKKGQVTQRPPIPYAASKSGLLMMTTRGTVKMKMPEGERKQAILSNGVDGEEYVKHLMSFDQLMEKKGYRADLADAAKAVLKAGLTLKKHTKVPKEENDLDKAIRLTKVKAAERELSAAKVVESTVACLAHDLFRKLTKDDPEIQWDRIVADMHTKNPWLDIRDVKHHGLCEKSNQSLIDCIEQHKLTFFACDAVERLKYYMMCSIKKPVRSTIRQHKCRMETLKKYLGMLPAIKNSPVAVASTELGNVPFTEATHASIILSHLMVAWRNQYNLTHKTVSESPRAMLLDLENIEKMQVKKYNEKAKASKAMAATAMAELRVPKKWADGRGSDRAPKKGRTTKYCKWCKAVNGSFTTHNTAECCRFEKDGSPKDRLVKSFDSVKKPWKKTGSGEFSQMVI